MSHVNGANGSVTVWEGIVENGFDKLTRYRVVWHGDRILKAAALGERLKPKEKFATEKRLTDATGNASWVNTGSCPKAVSAAMALELALLKGGVS